MKYFRKKLQNLFCITKTQLLVQVLGIPENQHKSKAEILSGKS